MDIKAFQKTQRELASTINQVIDTYWKDGIDEAEMVNHIKTLYSLNSSKFKKDNTYTTILLQKCGKRRLEVVEQIIRK